MLPTVSSIHGELKHIRQDVEKIMQTQEDMRADLRSGQDMVREILQDIAGSCPARPLTQSPPARSASQSPVAQGRQAFDVQKSVGSSVRFLDVTLSTSNALSSRQASGEVAEASRSVKVGFQDMPDGSDRSAGGSNGARNHEPSATLPPAPPRFSLVTSDAPDAAAGNSVNSSFEDDETEGSESDDVFDLALSKNTMRKMRKRKTQLHESWEKAIIPNRRCNKLGVVDIFASSVHEDNVTSPAAAMLLRSGTGTRKGNPLVRQFRRCCATVPGSGRFSMDRLVVSPSSYFSLLWSMFEGLLLVSDFIMIPMLMFDDTDDDGIIVPAGSPWSRIALWQRRISIVFWSVDLPLSFFKGFIDKNGERVVSFPEVAWKYLRCGVPLDVPLLCIEYVTFFLSSISEGRLLRILRYSRSLKAGKIHRLTRRLAARVKSPEGLAAMQIVGHLFAVILMCHISACLWYGIGTHFDSFGPQWTIAFVEETIFDTAVANHAFRYFTSLRWALAQLGFGDSQVYPRNWLESLFATIFSVLCVIVMTHLVGTIITSMIRIQEGKRDTLLQEGQMRDYLQQNTVTFDLQDRIWRVIKTKKDRRDHRTNENQAPREAHA